MKPAAEPSLEPSGDAVKEPKSVQKATRGVGRFARLLEGWELGAISVGLVLVTALLAVPRAARPGVFPVPLVDGEELSAARQRSAELADSAEQGGLPFETRAVGDALRRMGAALARGAAGSADAEHLQRLMSERVRAALRAGQSEPLLRLRAVQARLFVRAVHEHAWGVPASKELIELGGDFATRATQNGWLSSAGCVATDDELRTLFERRWVELTRLREEPRFKPALGELRRYYRFLILHPERGKGDDPPALERASMRLRYVEALAKRDTEYPIELARGSLLAELGAMPQSAQALSRYLSFSSGAEWNLRARNYLLYAARSDAAGEAEP
jgi:hypothetical protein